MLFVYDRNTECTHSHEVPQDEKYATKQPQKGVRGREVRENPDLRWATLGLIPVISESCALSA